MSNILKSSRRRFVKNMGFVGLGFMGLRHFVDTSLVAAPLKGAALAANNNDYGPLLNDPMGIINLPKGFSYKLISRQGNRMSDGLVTPGRPDGMATFPLDQDRVIIIRNHELQNNDLYNSPFGGSNELFPAIDRAKMYDSGRGMSPAIGGTTTLVFNLRTQSVEKEFMSLAGTIRNCAGGPTPWGSWITCEETVVRADLVMEKDHGFVFEVPASDKVGMVDPIPLTDMGRFNHEAVAVDPKSGIVYLTEDRIDGLFYRFIPNEPGKLAKGGKLQALAVKAGRGTDTRNWRGLLRPKFPANKPHEVEWIDIKNVLAPYDEIRYEGFFDGATRFARGEGIWFGEGELYFACTNGGANQMGQVFRYSPSLYEGTARDTEAPGKLELYCEPNDINLLENCDNLTISPWGDVVMAEDNFRPRIVGINPEGQLYHVAQNVAFASEFAGVCFSPDGSTLFVNIQHAGLTFAITGPWKA